MMVINTNKTDLNCLNNTPFVSVIIPVFNDIHRLNLCLEALDKQSYPQDCHEIIVVDNGSDESPEPVVERFDRARYVFEDHKGSYAARNKGITFGKGRVIAFTDSDCIPTSDWIEKGVANLLSIPNCGIVGGKVNVFFKNKNDPSAVELYDSLMNLQSKRSVDDVKFALTANLFTFKSVFDHIGLFNDIFKSGGDHEWGRRVFLNGYQVHYADDTIVAHPARNSFAQLYKKEVRVTGGLYQLMHQKEGYSFIIFMGDFASDLLPPIKRTFSICKDERIKKAKEKMKIIFIMVLLKYIRVWTKIRLQLGSPPARS